MKTTFVLMPCTVSCQNLYRTAQPESIFECVEHFFLLENLDSLMAFSYAYTKKSSDNLVVGIPLWLCNNLLDFGASTGCKAPLLSTLNVQSFAMTLLVSVVHFCHLLVESLNAHPNSTIFLTKQASFIQLWFFFFFCNFT